MKIFERIKRKYTNGDPSSAEKTGIQKKRIPYGYTFYPVLWNGGKYAVNLLLGAYGYMYVYAYIYEYREKKELFERTQRKISVQCRRNKHAICCAIRYSPGS